MEKKILHNIYKRERSESYAFTVNTVSGTVSGTGAADVSAVPGTGTAHGSKW
jgi:hypothetical protein